MNTFSFRAECLSDVRALGTVLANGDVAHELTITTYRDQRLPDVEVELRAASSLDGLRALVRQINDGQVMLQTLRQVPLIGNSLERDYALQ